MLLYISSFNMTANASGDDTISFGHPEIDHANQASLQRGAKAYMNYCSGCHSLQYMRYNQMAEGLGITDDEGNSFNVDTAYYTKKKEILLSELNTELSALSTCVQ